MGASQGPLNLKTEILLLPYLLPPLPLISAGESTYTHIAYILENCRNHKRRQGKKEAGGKKKSGYEYSKLIKVKKVE